MLIGKIVCGVLGSDVTIVMAIEVDSGMGVLGLVAVTLSVVNGYLFDCVVMVFIVMCGQYRNALGNAEVK